MLRSGTGLKLLCQSHDIPPLPPPVTLPTSFDPSLLMDHHILDPNDRYVHVHALSIYLICFLCAYVREIVKYVTFVLNYMPFHVVDDIN